MKVLLDENFPLALLHSLRDAGLEAEHIIDSGQRGQPPQRVFEIADSGELLPWTVIET